VAARAGGASKQHIDRRAVAVLTGTVTSAQLVVDDHQVTVVRWGDDDMALLQLLPRSGDINGQVSDAPQDGWSALAPDAGTCSTTKIVAGRSASSALANAIKLSTPPAEAPTTTMSRQPIASDPPAVIGTAAELMMSWCW
jgi:hypothetical protein